MLKRFFKKDTKEIEIKQEEHSNKTNKTYSLKEATEYIQRQLVEANTAEKEDRQVILRNAMAGDYKSYLDALKIINEILTEGKIQVPQLTDGELVKKIYATVWGLGVVEEYYRDPVVDEIRVNGPDNIYIIKQGKSYRSDKHFSSQSAIEQVIKRMIIGDMGLSIDRSSPRAESVRKDGSRLTATCYPVSKGWTFVLRKHGTFQMSKENLISAYTLNQEIWDTLKVLLKGRANILFSGNVGAGKTSLMRKMIEYTDPSLRLLAIGKDSELRLTEHYPQKDVIEMEEHSYVGATMSALFETALRLSPDCIIIEEFRGAGEAVEAIKACTRGHFGSMASAHFNNAEEAIEGTAMMMLEEGLTLPLELAELRVARAFNIIVQLYGDSITGIKKVIEITEVIVENNEIKYNPLLTWRPTGSDYMREGIWKKVNQPSEKLLNHMLRTVSKSEIESLGWKYKREPILTLEDNP